MNGQRNPPLLAYSAIADRVAYGYIVRCILVAVFWPPMPRNSSCLGHLALRLLPAFPSLACCYTHCAPRDHICLSPPEELYIKESCTPSPVLDMQGPLQRLMHSSP